MLNWIDDALRLIGRWCVLVFFAVLAFVIAGMALKPVFPDGLPPGPTTALVLGFVGAFALVAGHIAVVLIFERGDWSTSGMHAESWRPLPLLLSTLLGLAVIAVPAGVLLGMGQVEFQARPVGSWGRAALDALVWLAAPALYEELIARGYVFGSMARQWGNAAALAVTSLAFGLLHLWNPGATAVSVGAVVIAGIFLGSVRLATGSLAAAWLAHLAVNWAQGALLHAPISGLTFLPTPGYALVPSGEAWLTGGAWGLEASAVTALTLLVVTFLVLMVARRKSARRVTHRA